MLQIVSCFGILPQSIREELLPT